MPLLFQSPTLSHPSTQARPPLPSPTLPHGWHSSEVSEPELEAKTAVMEFKFSFMEYIFNVKMNTSLILRSDFCIKTKVFSISFPTPFFIKVFNLHIFNYGQLLFLSSHLFSSYSNAPQMWRGGCLGLYSHYAAYPSWSHLHQLDLTLSLLLFPLRGE